MVKDFARRDQILFSHLSSVRALVEPKIEEIKKHFDPFSEDENATNDVHRDRLNGIHETSGMHFGHMLLNFILARIYPPGAQWLRFAISPKQLANVDLTELLADIDNLNLRFTEAVDSSNYINEIIPTTWELLSIGNASVAIEPDRSRHARAPFSCTYLDFNRVWRRSNKSGSPDVKIVKYTMPAGEAWEFFDGKPGPAVLRLLQSGDVAATRLVDYLHIMELNRNYEAEGLRLPSKKMWSSRWISLEDKIGTADSVVRVSGMDESKYRCIGWRRTRNNEYSRGLCHLALADAAGLSQAFGMIINAWANNIDPPLMVADKDQVSGQMGPGSILVVRRAWMEPKHLLSGTDITAASELFGHQRNQIKEIFMGDSLMPPETQERSAQATIARESSQLTRLATFAVSCREFIRDQVELLVSHMYKSGNLPEIDEIANKLNVSSVSLVPVFVSPFFAAQRLAASQQTLDYVSAQLELANLSKDEDIRRAILSPIDFKKYSRVFAELAAVHHGIFFSEAEAERRMAAFADKQAQEQLMLARAQQPGMAAPATPSLMGRA